MSPLQRLGAHRTHQHPTYSPQHPTPKNLMSEQAPCASTRNHPKGCLPPASAPATTVAMRFSTTIVARIHVMVRMTAMS